MIELAELSAAVQNAPWILVGGNGHMELAQRCDGCWVPEPTAETDPPDETREGHEPYLDDEFGEA